MDNATPEPRDESRLDRIGAVASTACAVHCAICALLPAAFGILGLSVLSSPGAEWAFTLIAIAFAAGALFVGWRVHRSRMVFALLSLGIVGLLASRFMEMGSHHHGHDSGEQHAAVHSGGADSHEGDTGQKHSEGEKHDDGKTHHEKGESGSGHDAEGGDHGADHHEGHEGEEDVAHLAGAGVGVLAGLLLLFGHIGNIRSTRKSREECCS